MEQLSLSNVKSLFQSSVVTVVESLPGHLDNVHDLPTNVKDKILHLMSKRGLITDENIRQVIHSKVRVLDLTDCYDISDQSLHVLANNCKFLQKLDLNCTKGERNTITTQGIVTLAEGCQHLQVVYLRRCTSITDDAIIHLSSHCPALRELDMAGCVHITDSTLQALGHNSHRLTSINFAHSQVTDNGVYSLVSGPCGQKLQELHMNHCKELTDESVEAIVQYCPNISVFIFTGCPKLTDGSRIALEEITGRQSKVKQLTWTIY